MIKNIKLSAFRCFDSVELDFSKGINFFYGVNGSGKTSILESIFLCGNAKSFKTSKGDSLIKVGKDHFTIQASLFEAHKLITLTKSSNNRISININHAKVSAKKLLDCLPIISIDSKMFFFASNSPDFRRRVLDKTLFLLSKDYQFNWFSYHKALRQRNACLREGALQQAKSLNPMIVKYGTLINETRLLFIDNISSAFKSLIKKTNESLFFSSLARLSIQLFNGFESSNDVFELEQYFKDDCSRRTSTKGPHKADIILSLDDKPISEIFSRGEEKIFNIIFGLALSQALIESGKQCITLIDDLSSEIDDKRLNNLLKIIQLFNGQLFFSNISDVFNSTIDNNNFIKKFHMEQFN